MATFANPASCSRTVATKSSRKCTREYLRVHASASGAFGGHNSAAGSGGNPRANMSGVFQIQGSPVPCTMLDVRDAYEACSLTSSPAERRQCFEVYGLDSDKVDRYYDRVVSMERLIDQGDSVGQNMVASGGAMALYMLAWYILKV